MDSIENQIGAWKGQLDACRGSVPDIELVAPLKQSTAGGSGAFLGECSDGKQYWIKVQNNGQAPRVVVNEQIVGRAGTLIGAPVCTVKTVGISAELAGWEFRRGMTLEEGVGHASLQVEQAMETRKLEYRSKDKNNERQAIWYALHDWCFGRDSQWLMSVSADYAYYSHDHGHYFPDGPGWSIASLLQNLSVERRYPTPTDDLSREAAGGVVRSLEALGTSAILKCLCSIPVSWPVTDLELEAMGYFLEKRAVQVAERIRERFRL